MKKTLCFTLAVMMLSFLVPTISASAETTTVAGTPRSETLIVESLDGVISNPDQCNPYMSGTDFSAGLHQLVYANLWEINTITGDIYGDLADGLPVALNEDYDSFSVKIREGIHWSDGEVFDASDVVYTINMLLEHQEELSAGAWLATFIASTELVGDYELTINTTYYCPKLVSLLATTCWGNSFRVVPEHVFGAEGFDILNDLYTNPVAISAYTLADRDPNGNWFLYQKREDVEYSDVYVVTGQEPEPEYVLFTAYGTEEKKVMAMTNNECDILCDISPESWEVLQLSNEYVACWSSEYPYGCFDDPCERGMEFNCNNAPFDQAKVRWAMALALDITEVSYDAFNGQMRVSPLCMPPTTFMMENYFTDEMVEWLESYTFDDGFAPFDDSYALRISQMLIEDGNDYLATLSEDELYDIFGIGWWKYDAEEAEKLMTEAGCVRDDDGMWTYEGEVISFEIYCPSGFETQSERIAYPIAEQWRAFGIDATVYACESSTFNSASGLGVYTVGSFWPSCGTLLDLYSQLEGWDSQYITENGVTCSDNSARWSNEEFDELVHQMASLESDDPEVYTIGCELLKIMVDDVAWLPMFGTTKLVPTNNYYWTNYPTEENAYDGPWWWWSTFKFIMVNFESTGNE